MNVLMIDEEVPFPLNTGKRIRTYHLIKRLQERHRIIYLCYENRENRLPKLPNVSFIQLKSPVIEQKGFGFYWALLKNLTSPRPYIVDRHFSLRMKEAVEDIVRREKIDLLHCEWTPYTENIKDFLSMIPSVLSAHNVEAQIWARYHHTERHLIKKRYIYHQWQKIQRYEKKASRLYKQIITVSENDQKIFQDVYNCPRVTIVPNGVDERYFSPRDGEINPGNMVFTGSLDWRPNQDGIQFFLSEMFPKIKEQFPQVTFTVVGRKPPDWLVRLSKAHAGVTFTGTVDDVRPFIGQCAIYLVPLRIGGGSRLKILEALAMGKPVLSTTVGAEGLMLKDGEHLYLRDNPEHFAGTAVKMLTNLRPCQEMGLRGRQVVLEKYAWDGVAEILDKAWQKAVNA